VTATYNDYDETTHYAPTETVPRETYVPWFPPCRPCGHCPACGRPTAPLLPPMYLPPYSLQYVSWGVKTDGSHTLYN
jgi:hypothetical protein